jgi:transposase
LSIGDEDIMKYIYGKDRKQMEIGCLEDSIEEDNEVRVIDALIDALDIESLGFEIGNNKATGRPSFDPRDMIKLYVYGYFYGIRSSRKLAR